MTQPNTPSLSETIFGSEPDPAPVKLSDLATETQPAQRRLTAQRIHVELEDGTSFDVTTSNKDYLRWDKTPAPLKGVAKDTTFQDVPFVFASFLAWAAAQRQGLTELTWRDFQEQAEVVEQIKQEDVPPTQ